MTRQVYLEESSDQICGFWNHLIWSIMDHTAHSVDLFRIGTSTTTGSEDKRLALAGWWGAVMHPLVHIKSLFYLTSHKHSLFPPFYSPFFSQLLVSTYLLVPILTPLTPWSRFQKHILCSSTHSSSSPLPRLFSHVSDWQEGSYSLGKNT